MLENACKVKGRSCRDKYTGNDRKNDSFTDPRFSVIKFFSSLNFRREPGANYILDDRMGTEAVLDSQTLPYEIKP